MPIEPILAASFLPEWGQFLSGAAAATLAFIATAKWVVSILERRNKAAIQEAMSEVFMAKIKNYLTHAAEVAGPHKTRVIDIKFLTPEALIRLPVIVDKWLTVLPGCEIMGDEYASDYTTYFVRVDNAARLRRHTHEGEESVLVIKGSMKDMSSGKVYLPGETWDIPPGTVHSVLFEAPEDSASHGLYLVTVRPPLPTSAQVLLQLDGLATLAGTL